MGFDANGDAIQATKAAAAVRKITIEANQTADFEDNDFSGKRSLMESVEAKTKDIMPVAFEFKCVPFEGLKERPFKLRLSIITGDRPVLVLRIIQLEAVQEEMANEFRDLLVEKFKDSKNKMSFIKTFSGKHFYYDKINKDDIDINDIAVSLSNICRFAGHLSHFYSVAQHAVLCSQLVPQEFAFEALMHDATEAYCQDIPAPLKRLLPDYKRMEEKNRRRNP